MHIIGLTGSSGSGKTTVGRMLEKRGAALIEVDPLAQATYAVGEPAWQEIIDVFGSDVLGPDGSIDRRKLGAIVFRDPSALNRLNAITHPRAKELVRQRLAQLAAEGREIAVIDAALLLEAGWRDLVDEVWVTVSPQEVVVRRTAQRLKLTEEEALARIRNQMSNEERIRQADVVIDTSSSLEQTEQEVEKEWQRLNRRLAKAGSRK